MGACPGDYGSIIYVNLVPRPEKRAWYTPTAHASVCTQNLGTSYIPVKYPVNYPLLVTSSCLNLLSLQSKLNVPSAEGSFYWIESKLQEENLLCGLFELNAQLPCGK